MSTLIFTDPHLGLSLRSNTTPASRVLLMQALEQQLIQILDHDGPKICIGDFFHTYSNDEATLSRTFPLLQQLDLCLAGNHDLISIRDRMGSLQLLSELHPGVVVHTPFGEAGAFVREIDGVRFIAVPHTTTQDLFEGSLRQAQELSGQGTGPCILLTHSNYENNFVRDQESQLHLSREQAEGLLNHFDYVVLGHEHIPRDDLDGRLIILGNTHPTGFADMSDKRVMYVEDGKIRFEPVWSMAEGYREYSLDTLPEAAPCPFIRLNDTLDRSDIRTMTQKVAAIWRNSPELLAFKVNVQLNGVEALDVDNLQHEQLERLPELIRRELQQRPELASLWDEFTTGEED